MMLYFERLGLTFALDTESYIVYEVKANNFLDELWEFETFSDFVLQINDRLLEIL